MSELEFKRGDKVWHEHPSIPEKCGWYYFEGYWGVKTACFLVNEDDCRFITRTKYIREKPMDKKKQAAGERTEVVTNWQAKYFKEADAHYKTKEQLDIARECFERACGRAAKYYRGDLMDYLFQEIRKEVERLYKKQEGK